jgi:hypothetical protein
VTTPVRAGARAYFEHVRSLQAAMEAERGPWIERPLRIAGRHLLLRFGSPALVPPLMASLCTRALPPRAAEDGLQGPELTLHLWDSAGSGLPAPPSPPAWLTGSVTQRFPSHGEIPEGNREGIRSSFELWPNTLQLLEAASGHGFFWIEDSNRVSLHGQAAPLLRLLSWWIAGCGGALLHAAAVGTAEAGVLVAGAGGRGKSTTALLSLCAGLQYAGDDYTLVTGGRQPRAHGLYASAKLKALEDLHRFPALAGCVVNPSPRPGEKLLLQLAGTFPEQLGDGFPLRALLIPQIGGRGPAWLEPLSPKDALAAAAPSAVAQLPGTAREAFAVLSDLVRRLPCFLLHTGSEPASIPPLIAGWLERNR